MNYFCGLLKEPKIGLISHQSINFSSNRIPGIANTA